MCVVRFLLAARRAKYGRKRLTRGQNAMRHTVTVRAPAEHLPNLQRLAERVRDEHNRRHPQVSVEVWAPAAGYINVRYTDGVHG